MIAPYLRRIPHLLAIRSSITRSAGPMDAEHVRRAIFLRQLAMSVMTTILIVILHHPLFAAVCVVVWGVFASICPGQQTIAQPLAPLAPQPQRM